MLHSLLSPSSHGHQLPYFLIWLSLLSVSVLVLVTCSLWVILCHRYNQNYILLENDLPGPNPYIGSLHADYPNYFPPRCWPRISPRSSNMDYSVHVDGGWPIELFSKTRFAQIHQLDCLVCCRLPMSHRYLALLYSKLSNSTGRSNWTHSFLHKVLYQSTSFCVCLHLSSECTWRINIATLNSCTYWHRCNTDLFCLQRAKGQQPKEDQPSHWHIHWHRNCLVWGYRSYGILELWQSSHGKHYPWM